MNELLLGNDMSTEAGEPLVDVSSLTDAAMPLLWLSASLTLLFIALYIRSSLKRRKLEKAILDIQKTVHEINERDKAQSARPKPPLPRSDSDRIIAAKPQDGKPDSTDSA